MCGLHDAFHSRFYVLKLLAQGIRIRRADLRQNFAHLRVLIDPLGDRAVEISRGADQRRAQVNISGVHDFGGLSAKSAGNTDKFAVGRVPLEEAIDDETSAAGCDREQAENAHVGQAYAVPEQSGGWTIRRRHESSGLWLVCISAAGGES
jgi:hypothetical protein